LLTTGPACQQRQLIQPDGRLPHRFFNMMANVFDIPSGTVDGVAAACSEEAQQRG
jgi:hypothetical protein